MNLLIVDDEAIAIEGIKVNVNWDMLEFEHIYEANSMQQAMSLLTAYDIDIMLCDIEMPNGSGLDLIEWVNAHYPEVISIILSCHGEFDFARQAVSLACLDYILKPATPDDLMKVLGRAAQQVHEREKDARYRKYGEDYMSRLAGGGDEDKDAVEKVCNFIADHVEEDLSVEKLAEQAYLNPNYLTRVFKKRIGKTVTEYITEYRLRLAEDLLRDTRLSITMISAKVGYQNYTYFIKQFKKFTGYAPREYRQKYGAQKVDGIKLR